jgi:hypothetical protein
LDADRSRPASWDGLAISVSVFVEMGSCGISETDFQHAHQVKVEGERKIEMERGRGKMILIRRIATAGLLLGLLLLAVTSGMGASLVAQGIPEPSYGPAPGYGNPGPVEAYTPGELDVILGPIALYPDPLLAQILPAATFPDQLLDADDLIRQPNGANEIDLQNWDISVKAIAHYPSVLVMMVDKPDWTTSVGQAYLDQPGDVMASVQRLRSLARSLGYLSSNAQQRVYIDSGYIRIVPVQAGYIYVPQYDPQVVYVQRRGPSTMNALSFGLGVVIGAWLNRDMDWQHNRIYYHGWSGGSWIRKSKPHVSIRNNNYVNENYRNKPIPVNPGVRTRDLGSFRTNLKRNVGSYKVPESRKPNRTNTRSQSNGRDNGPRVH